MHAIVLRHRGLVPHRCHRLFDGARIGVEHGGLDGDGGGRNGRAAIGRRCREPRREHGITTDEGQTTGSQQHFGVDFTADLEAP